MATTVTFREILNELAQREGLNFNPSVATATLTDETRIANAVMRVNSALRWIWICDDALFAWPATISTASSVTITSGVITWAAVSNSNWVSFWESDPRINASTGVTVNPIPVMWDGTQFKIQSSTASTPCFAFYRAACPQGTYVAGAATDGTKYATPTVPEQFLDPVLRYAHAEFLANHQAPELAAVEMQRAINWMEGRKGAILDGKAELPWADNINVIV